MARIRSVKPELRRDLTVADWPKDCRYAWVLLWGYLDDHGRGLDDMRLLTADLFPLDRDVTEKKLDGWLDLMAAENDHGEPPLCRYQIAGRRYLHSTKWVCSQRVSHPQGSKIPSCPIHERIGSSSGTIPESIPNETGTVPSPFRTSRAPEGLGVKGSREKETEAAPAEPPRIDVETVCSVMAEVASRITNRQQKVTPAWRTEARLLLDKDERSVDTIVNVIRWVEKDPFWRKNIHGVPKLRIKFDQLYASAGPAKRRCDPNKPYPEYLDNL